MIVSLEMVKAAQTRIRNFLEPTPVEDIESAVSLKLEIVNPGHSFKIRGALNAALIHSRTPLITASNGNHAIALSVAGRMVGAKVTVVIPESASEGKKRRLAELDAEIIQHGSALDNAELHARLLARQRGSYYVSAYNDSDVIAGAGVVGLEIVSQYPDVRRIYVPTGGGGLAGGIAVAVSEFPGIEVVACCPDHSTALMAATLALDNGIPGPSIADALVGGIEPDSITISLVRDLKIGFSLVSDAEIKDAVCRLLSIGWLVEPSGAVGAACLWKDSDNRDRSVAILSGSNTDIKTLRETLAE